MVIETSLLTAALFEAAKQVAEKAIVEKGLEKGLEPFQKWLTHGYDEKKADEDLRQAFSAAIQKMGAPVKDEKELSDWYQKNGLVRLQSEENRALRHQVALAVVDFVDENAPPPEAVMVALGWPRHRAQALSELLTYLRAGLAGTSWQPLLDYANDLQQRGLLKDVLGQLARMANAITSTPEGEALRVVLVERLKLSEVEIQEIEQEYRSLVEAEFRMHRMQGMRQVAKTIGLPLKDIYLEPGLRPLRSPRQQAEELETLITEGPEKRLQRSLRETDQRVSRALHENQKIVIVGAPGSGKTISLKFVALMLALGEAGVARLGLRAPYLPFYLRLADFARELQSQPTLSLEAYLLQNQLPRQYSTLPYRDEFLTAALKKGACMVLLDGLDEVGDTGEELVQGQTLRQIVLRQVQRFTDQRCGPVCGNRVVVTSRLEGYRPGDLDGFAELEISPLRLPDEVESFLLRWYTAYFQQHDEKLTFLQAQARAQASVKQILVAIERSDSVKLLAINPLLLTILAIINENLGVPLPQRRAELYDVVAMTLVETWRKAQTDVENRIHNLLTVSNIYFMMSSLAYWLHENKRGGTMPLEDWRQQISTLLPDYVDEKEIEGQKKLQELVNEFLNHATQEAGLLTERSSGQIGFFHLTLEEYLAAVEIARKNESRQKEMAEKHWQEAYWQEVLLLAAGELSRRGNDDSLAVYLTNFLDFKPSGPDQAGRNVHLAGRALADIGQNSVNARTQRLIKERLRCVAQDLDFDCKTPNTRAAYPPRLRADCADALDELGYVPDDLHCFVHVEAQPDFWMARYPVTNAQYARFLQPENFESREYWCDFPKFDEYGRGMKGQTWGTQGWDWLQRELQDKDNRVENGVLYPPYWNHPQFGYLRPSAPVVTITWYEANAYCRWLLARWDELEEARHLARPELVRLPERQEWVPAAGRAEPEERFPWEPVGEANSQGQEEQEIIANVLQRANVSQSGIGRTTPVWMYPQGACQPYEIMDLGGNALEWQANYDDKDHKWLGLSGGSWGSDWDGARVAWRRGYYPSLRFSNIGFRVVALPSVS